MRNSYVGLLIFLLLLSACSHSPDQPITVINEGSWDIRTPGVGSTYTTYDYLHNKSDRIIDSVTDHEIVDSIDVEFRGKTHCVKLTMVEDPNDQFTSVPRQKYLHYESNGDLTFCEVFNSDTTALFWRRLPFRSQDKNTLVIFIDTVYRGGPRRLFHKETASGIGTSTFLIQNQRVRVQGVELTRIDTQVSFTGEISDAEKRFDTFYFSPALGNIVRNSYRYEYWGNRTAIAERATKQFMIR